MKCIIIAFTVLLMMLSIPVTQASTESKPTAIAVPDTSLENFYEFAPGLFRAGQPNKMQMMELHARGFQSVLNLRNHNNDIDEAKGLTLMLYRVAMNAGSMRDDKMVKALTVLYYAPKPIVVHCWHGSDRTGAVVAMYRMVFQGWTRQAAIDELMQPEFGHHRLIYRNIRHYLNKVDINDIRRQVMAAKLPPALISKQE